MTIPNPSIQNAAYEGNLDVVRTILEANPDGVRVLDEVSTLFHKTTVILFANGSQDGRSELFAKSYSLNFSTLTLAFIMFI